MELSPTDYIKELVEENKELREQIHKLEAKLAELLEELESLKNGK